MIISDLEHLEVVREEDRIEGGVQLVSGASSSSSGAATTGGVFVSNFSSSGASQFSDPFFGTSTSTFASGSSSGSTFPSFF